MESAPDSTIATLLRETETAHGAYETDELGGAFDVDWAVWYSKHLLDHGLRDRLPGGSALDVDSLTALLTRLDMDYQQNATSEPWPDIYARGILAAFS